MSDRRQLEVLAAEVDELAAAAAADPERRGDYLELLVELAEVLLERRELSDALAVTDEAVHLVSALIVEGRRELSVTLAVALRMHGDALLELDEAEAALGAYAQAIRLLADLAQVEVSELGELGELDGAGPRRSPSAELATTLLHHGEGLRRSGRVEDGLEILDRALALARGLLGAAAPASGGDAAEVPRVARVQIARGRALAELGSVDEGLASMREAVAIYRELGAGLPELYTLDYAETLDALASLLRSLDRAEEALAPAEEALSLVTGLARADGVRYLYPLARLTHNLARCNQRAERYDRAAALFEQAEQGFALLAAAQPHVHQATRIEVMGNHALARAQLGELDRAHAIASESLALAEAEPGWRLLPLITGTRQFLADLAVDLGRPDEAFERLRAGLRLLQEAADAGLPGAVEARERLAASLRQLGATHGFALPAELHGPPEG